MNLRVLVVDDTIFYRMIIKNILSEIPGVEVVGTVNSGALALNRIGSLKPDLLTLDVEMPGMSGLQVLEEIQKRELNVGVIMISSKTQTGSEATVKALELGAFDFIAKPEETSPEENTRQIKTKLETMLRIYARQRDIKRMLGGSTKSPERQPFLDPAVVSPPITPPRLARMEKSVAVAIGISTGGPNALAQMLPQLPADINIPIFLVQHMPPVFSASLANSLDKKCALRVKEAENGEKVEPNTVYVAQGGKQMKVAVGSGFSKIIRVTDDPPENNCKPSVDYLFRSVAREFGSKVTCVIMTGMGEDGKLGMTITKAAGAFSIAQDAASCVVYGMPKAVVDAQLADVVCPLDRVAAEILKTLK